MSCCVLSHGMMSQLLGGMVHGMGPTEDKKVEILIKLKDVYIDLHFIVLIHFWISLAILNQMIRHGNLTHPG